MATRNVFMAYTSSLSDKIKERVRCPLLLALKDNIDSLTDQFGLRGSQSASQSLEAAVLLIRQQDLYPCHSRFSPFH